MVELLTLDVDGSKIDVFQYKHALEQVNKLTDKLPSLAKEYADLSQNLTFQTTLKLLKKGNSQ